jgi:anthranilate phosphoribosyltransferase
MQQEQTMSAEGPDFKQLIAKVADGTSLSMAEAASAFDIMMSGDATPAQMGGFLIALRVRGESVEEITGGVMTMRDKMTAIEAPADAMDVVGTGGDGKHTLNISTAAAIVVAGCGVPVAKHGNRAASSQSGTVDAQAALGINVDADFPLIRESVWEAGICFMAAQRHHGAMRNVGPVRVELGTRTIFNLLGPLSNPANVKRQLIGVFSAEWLEPMARTLNNLGSEKVWLVHGSDGTDELTTTGPSTVVALDDGEISTFQLDPADIGIARATLDDLQGGTPVENAAALTRLLAGETGAYRDIVLYNAAAALMVADRVRDLQEGVEMAAEAIDSGEASSRLVRLVEITNRPTD